MDEMDVNLIRRVQQHVPGAFDELYERYYAMVYHLAIQITKQDADAKDAAQETFIQIDRSIDQLREPQMFYPWVKKIVTSKCSRIFERNHYRSVDSDIIEKVNHACEERRYMVPQDAFHFKSDQEILHEMIDNLKPAIKEAMTYMYFEQMKLQEISDLLQVPLSTIKSRVKVGRDELQKKIKEFEKKEGRHLDFNLNALFPITGFFTFGHWSIIRDKIMGSLAGNMVNVVCVSSISVLSVSGAVFAYADAQINTNPRVSQHIPYEVVPMQQHANDDVAISEPDVEAVSLHLPYQDGFVENEMQAFYTCLNFADTQEKMKTRSLEEFKEIQPIYEVLKKNQGVYYQTLKQMNWDTTFEALARGIIV